MGQQRRYYSDLESGNFIIEANSLLDDQVSRLSDPASHHLLDKHPSVQTNNDHRHQNGNGKQLLFMPIQYLKKVASKKRTSNNTNQWHSEDTKLLLKTQLQQEKSIEEERQSLQPSPTYYLSEEREDDLSSSSLIFQDDSPRTKSPLSSGGNNNNHDAYRHFASIQNDVKHSQQTKFCTVARSYLRSVVLLNHDNTTIPGPTKWVVMLSMYLLLGSLTYIVWLEPKWSFLDALYRCMTLTTTVGYTSTTTEWTSVSSIIFTCTYALVGSCGFITMGMCCIVHEEARLQKQAGLDRQDVVMSLLKAGNEAPPKTGYFDRIGFIIKMGLVGLWLPFVVAALSGWTWIETMYYFVSTVSTVGQGEVAPTTFAAKVVVVIFIPMAIIGMMQSLYLLARYLTSFTRNNTSEKWQELSQHASETSHLTRAEFLELTLLSMKKMDLELVGNLRNHYDQLLQRTQNGEQQFLRTRLIQTLQNHSL